MIDLSGLGGPGTLPNVAPVDVADDEQYATAFTAYAKEAEDALQTIRSLVRARAAISSVTISFEEAKARRELLGICLQAQDNLRFYRARVSKSRRVLPHARVLGCNNELPVEPAEPGEPVQVLIEWEGKKGGDAS